MFDFIKFAKEHPGISVNIEYWRHSLRGIVITLEKLQPSRIRWRFCLDEELYFENPYHIDVDGYIEMWLNQGLKDIHEKEKEDGEPLKKEGTNDQN